MTDRDNKRIRKPVNYTAFLEESVADGDEDFAEFSSPRTVKESSSACSSQGSQKGDRSYCSESNTQDSDLSDWEAPKTKSKDRDRHHKKHKSKDKDSHRKDKDRHKSKNDKDRSREKRDRERERSHSKYDKEKDRSKDKYEKRDKYKDRERSEKYKDKDRHKKDRDKDNLKHDKPSVINGENSVASDKKNKQDESDDDFKMGNNNSTASPMTSTQKSPGRTPTSGRTPKPRLSVEEKIFQRELEEALAISKIATKDKSNATISTPAEMKAEVTEVQNEIKSTPTSAEKPLEKSTCPDQNAMNVNSLIKEAVPESCKSTPQPLNGDHDKTCIVPESTCQQNVSEAPQEKGEPKDEEPKQKELKDEEPKEKEELKDELVTNNEENQLKITKLPIVTAKDRPASPQPSTSCGFTGKRQRKKVVFKEDSDSDSFDGFDDGGGDSNFSEESDFSPSPKKRKVKERSNTKKSKSPKSASRPSTKKPNDASAKQKSSPRRTVPTSAAKENTVPKTPVRSPKPKPNIKLTSPVIQNSARGKVVSQTASHAALCSTPSSPSSGGMRSIGLVKSSFRSPVLQSAGSASNSPCKVSIISSGTARNTGLRLGLSRRSNFKPLHPNISGK